MATIVGTANESRAPVRRKQWKSMMREVSGAGEEKRSGITQDKRDVDKIRSDQGQNTEYERYLKEYNEKEIKGKTEIF